MNWDVLGLPGQLVFQNLTNKILGSYLLIISLFIADFCMVKNVYILCSNLYVCPLCGTWYLHLNARLFADGMWKCIVCRE